MITSDYQIARIWGIPIRIHFSLVLFLPIIAWQFSPIMGEGLMAWLGGLGIAIGLFTSVAFHELGHSLIAIRMGFRVRDIILLPIGGAAQLERIPSQPRQELVMALAGPAVSLFLGAGCWWVAHGVFAHFRWVNASKVLMILAQLNFGLMLFNLIPSFPMGGGRVLRALLTPTLGRLKATRLAANIGRAIAILFGIIGAYPPFNLLLVAIAFFIYSTASAEYRMVQREEAWKARSGLAP